MRYQLYVTYLESPYTSKCTFYAHKKYKFQKYEPILYRGDCFTECLKREYRLGSFYYSRRDKDEYRWDNTTRDEALKNMQFIKNCSETCKNLNCKF